MVSELGNRGNEMYCIQCGNKLKTGAKFCTNCGMKIQFIEQPVIEQHGENNAGKTDRAGMPNAGMYSVKNHIDIKNPEKKNSNVNRSRFPLIIGIIMAVLLIGTAIYAYAAHLSPAAQVRSQLELGNKFLYAGRYEEAILAFEKAIEIQPKSIEARLGLSKAYQAINQPDKAEVVLKEALDIDPKREDIYLALFDLYISIGEGEKAVRIIEKGIEETDSDNLRKKLEEIFPKKPKANLKSGEYTGMKTVELTGRDENSVIYYTLDGTEVSKNSKQYTEPIVLKEGKTILKAASINEYGIIGDTIEYEYIIVSASGNSCGNFMNSALVAESDEGLYHINFTGDPNRYGLYKTSKSENDSIRISDGPCNSINVLGDWIYFLKFEDNYNRIYRMKTDGSEISLVVDDNAFKPFVTGEWIYYINRSDNNKLYKVKTDGSSKIKVCDDTFVHTYEDLMLGPTTEISDFYVIDEWIYYINYSDRGRLYRMKTDGSSKSKLSEDSIYTFIVDGDAIYYNNSSDRWRFYTIKTDGSNHRKLCDYGGYEQFNIYDGWIYYCDTSDGELYKLSINGDQRIKIDNEKLIYLNSDLFGTVSISIVNDWIYYYSCSSEKWFKIKIDGSEKTDLSIY